MLIVDTSVLIDYLGDFYTPQTEYLDRRIGLQRVGITSLILTEVLQGIREERLFASSLSVLSQFTVLKQEVESWAYSLRSTIEVCGAKV